MAETLVEKTVREAEEACQSAILSTPEAYRGFITLIPQSKRLGNRQNPQYANIRLPYMGVDGRVKQAMDEHRAAGARLTIDTTFDVLGDKTVCRAVVNSSLFGSASGTAVVNLGGAGVDSTNPIENGETSAIGRALGFLGYGLFGTGIASAEEVLAAMKPAQEEHPTQPTVEPATQKQLGLLYSLLKTVGIQDGHKRELIAQVSSAYHGELPKAKASEVIDYIQNKKECPGWLRVAYVRFLGRKYGMNPEEIISQMDREYGHHDPIKLSQNDFNGLVNKLIPAASPVAEPVGTSQRLDPDDIYLPGELNNVPLKPVTPKEWVDLTKNTCTACQLTAKDFEAWAIAQFGGGKETQLTELQREAFNAIAAMDIDKIKGEVLSYCSGFDKQVALTA